MRSTVQGKRKWPSATRFDESRGCVTLARLWCGLPADGGTDGPSGRDCCCERKEAVGMRRRRTNAAKAMLVKRLWRTRLVKDSKKSSDARHRGIPILHRDDPAPACAKRWRGACAVLKARPADSACRAVRRAGSAGAFSTDHDSFAGGVCGGSGGSRTCKFSTPHRGVPHGRPADWLLFLPATSVTGRGLHGACNHRCHCQQRLRVRFPQHEA